MSVPLGRVTVAEALALPVLRRGLPEVVGGRAGLDRPLRWVHAGEVPNIASLLRGGELLLTTGMGIARRADGQRRFVAELAERDVAALVVELGGAFETLPRALVEAAEARGLPLVALRREVLFVAVTEAVHTELVNRQYALLRRGDEIHRELVALMLDGHGVPGVLRALAEHVGNPVLLEDGDGSLLFHAGPAGGAPDAVAAWETARGRAAGVPWRGVLARPVATGTQARPGQLVALPLERPLDALAEVAVERAAGIVSLALLRTRQEDELRARERGELLADLAEGRIAAGEAVAQARAVGFPDARELLPLAAEAGGGPPPAAGAWEAALADARHALEGRGASVLLGSGRVPGRLLALVALREPAARPGAADAVAAALRGALARRLGPREVAVAAGRAVGWEEAGAALALAADGAACAVALPAAAWHDVDALELSRLLWRWREDPELAALVERTLGPLIAHDRRRAHRLLPTLEALCAHGGRKAETARALHLNRQALYRRIERIERLLAVDLDDPRALLRLHVALEARRYAGELPQATERRAPARDARQIVPSRAPSRAASLAGRRRDDRRRRR
ncbi:MAG TPA: PucR family transcriptional regulator [Conexibacter sp.]|nr:PucR family transcriptional regulator [Conexibacter sp.]